MFFVVGTAITSPLEFHGQLHENETFQTAIDHILIGTLPTFPFCIHKSYPTKTCFYVNFNQQTINSTVTTPFFPIANAQTGRID
jgi:hypothetical protein